MPAGFQAFDEAPDFRTDDRGTPPAVTRDHCRVRLLRGMSAPARREALARTNGHWPFPPVVPTPMRPQELEIVSPFRRIDWLSAALARAPAVLVTVACVASFVA